MFNKYVQIIFVVVFFYLFTPGSVLADSPPESGFFDDYSRLQSTGDKWESYIYTKDNFHERVAAVQAIVIEQPELFLAPDSKYKGMKPQDMGLISNSMRELVVAAFEDGYQIAHSPGPNTIAIRMAFSNLYLKKKPRIPVIGWLPPAYVMTTVKRKMLDKFADNVLMTELVWEGELIDTETGEVIGQILSELGNHLEKKEFSSWDELVVSMSVGAARLRCRFDNAKLPESERRNCLEITETNLLTND